MILSVFEHLAYQVPAAFQESGAILNRYPSKFVMEHFDVLIVGAGLSGIGAAARLKMDMPAKTFAIFEGREAMGGTWDLFRYPGVRSDSDMYTLGYRFRPWSNPESIADGPAILKYIQETSAEFQLDDKIRYNHRVRQAAWSSEHSVWSVDVSIAGIGVNEGSEAERSAFTCNFLYLCTGYYDYSAGYTPEWPSLEKFKGKVIHPQKWPDDIDYNGKRVVVIGSGATAVTLVPAMAEKAEHVTMLQRSPTYIVSLPKQDKIANFLRSALPAKAAYAISRWKNVLWGMFFYNLSKRRPSVMKGLIAKGVRKELGEEITEKHFNPTYNPWDQRLCLVPDADLFRSIRNGRASIVTGKIESFTETGILLTSGEHLAADMIITATGLVLKIMSGLELIVDGATVELSKVMAYKGMMYSDIPNLPRPLAIQTHHGR